MWACWWVGKSRRKFKNFHLITWSIIPKMMRAKERKRLKAIIKYLRWNNVVDFFLFSRIFFSSFFRWLNINNELKWILGVYVLQRQIVNGKDKVSRKKKVGRSSRKIREIWRTKHNAEGQICPAPTRARKHKSRAHFIKLNPDFRVLSSTFFSAESKWKRFFLVSVSSFCLNQRRLAISN